MSINCNQLASLIIKPTLREIDLFSNSAVNLLLGTCAQESHLGTYFKQIGKGPAVGIFQMEPDTFNDILMNFLIYRPELIARIQDSLGCMNVYEFIAKDMIWNLKLAVIMCRLHYLRAPESLPNHNDINGLAKYWKKYYNTEEGKGKIEDFIINYKRFIEE